MKQHPFKIGVNLGGWISQYQYYDHRHFETFIQAADIQQIADWGFDHVRLPVDYPVLESDERPGDYLTRGWGYIEACLNWCQAAGLGLIIDLHRAPGYSFTNTLEIDGVEMNALFSDPAMQARFINLWAEFAQRYRGQFGDSLVFELLNEMVLPDSAPWNALAQRSIDRIGAIDPQRLIMVGGNHYNAAAELQHIAVKPDPNLLYTFHFYLPMVITHQKAPWVGAMRKFNQTAHYPGSVAGLAEFIAENPQYEAEYGDSVGCLLDKNTLIEALKPALDFAKGTDLPVYCGEFGVIDRAPLQTRINWTRDMVAILKEHAIGYGYWSYKAMDFGLVDAEGKVISPELVRAVTGA